MCNYNFAYMIILIIQFVILIIITQNISCLPIELVITVLMIMFYTPGSQSERCTFR